MIKLPAIVTGPRGYVGQFLGEEDFQECRLLAVANGFYLEARVYDSAGLITRVENILQPRLNFFRRIVAYTLNPRSRVELQWAEQTKYDLSDLKNILRVSIENDPGILTQFRTEKSLLKMLDAAETFEQIFQGLKKARSI